MWSISSNYLNVILSGCVERGADHATLLALIPGGNTNLRNPSRRFNANLAAQILNAAAEMTDDGAIGIVIGMMLRPDTFNDLGYALPFCHDLRGVLELNAIYQPLTQQLGTSRLIVDDTSAWITWYPHYRNYEFYRHFVDMVFSGYASIGRWLLWGKTDPVRSMHFRHSAPPDLKRHKAIFSGDLHFDADEDKIEFIAKAVDVQMPSRNPDMLRYLRVKLDEQLAALTQPVSIATEVKRLIQKELPVAKPSIIQVARIMGQSQRSLRRRLEEEGVTFRMMLVEARMESCEAYIRAGRHSQTEIAQLLGFSDHSAYSRAFKTWFGMTPRAYLKALNQPPHTVSQLLK